MNYNRFSLIGIFLVSATFINSADHNKKNDKETQAFLTAFNKLSLTGSSQAQQTPPTTAPKNQPTAPKAPKAGPAQPAQGNYIQLHLDKFTLYVTD